METLTNEAKKMGLEINEGKTKFMKITAIDRRTDTQDFVMENVKFEKFRNFTYLGTVINNKNIISEEIDKRIMIANRAYYANSKILKSRLISHNTKMKIYKTLIRPVATYGAEAWTLTTKDATKLKTLERKVVRRIYGGINENGLWRVRNNKEINDILQGQDIVKFIKAQRIRWLGHVMRMDAERMPKAVYKTKMEGQRKRGRPRSRWGDEIEKDLREMGINNWRSKAQDREKWRGIVREAKAHPAL